MKEYGEYLFPQTPVVFTGINNFTPALIDGLEGWTGVAERVAFKENIDLILDLHPEVGEIIVYGDDTTTFLKNKLKLSKLADAYDGMVSLIFKDQLVLEEVLEDIASLKDDQVVLLSSTIKDIYGNVVPYAKVSELLSANTSVPIYGVWDFFLGQGVVGGKLTRGFIQGEEAAKLAKRVLLGEEPGYIPVVEDIGNEYIFDYEQLSRFNIDIDLLPRDSRIINIPPSYWERNKFTLIPFLLVILIILSILILSILHNFKLQTAKEKLDSEKNFRK